MKKSLFLLLISFASLHNVTTPAVGPVVANAAVPAGQMLQGPVGRQVCNAMHKYAPDLFEKYPNIFDPKNPVKVSGNSVDGFTVGRLVLSGSLLEGVVNAVDAEQAAFDLIQADNDGMGLVKPVTPPVDGLQEVVNYWSDKTSVPSVATGNQPCAYEKALDDMLKPELPKLTPEQLDALKNGHNGSIPQNVLNATMEKITGDCDVAQHAVDLNRANADGMADYNPLPDFPQLTSMEKLNNFYNAHKNVIIGTTAAITVALSYMAYQYWKSLQATDNVVTTGEITDSGADLANEAQQSSLTDGVEQTEGTIVPTENTEQTNVVTPQDIKIPTLKDKIFNNLRALSNAQKAAIGSALAAVGLGASYKIATKKPALDHLAQQYLYDVNEENMQIKVDNFIQAAVQYGYTSEEDEIYIANILAELDLI